MAKKRSFAFGLLFLVMLLVAGCGSTKKASTKKDRSGEASNDREQVRMFVWSGSEDQEMMKQVIDNFVKENEDKAGLNIVWKPVEEGDSRTMLLNNVQKGGDVYVTTDGDLRLIAAGGAALPLNTAQTKQVQQDDLAASVKAITQQKKVYGYPLTADNGYFLYYNKKYFKDKDVKNLNDMLAVAAAKHKKIAMDWSSGWYLYSFFGETGMRLGLNMDGSTNYCNWNSTNGDITGADVVDAMKEIAKSPAFANMNQNQWDEAIAKGDVIACVSGVWDENAIKKAWGDDTGACVLPTYNVAGQKLQMSSFFGYKVVAVNPYSENLKWAKKFAEYLANEQNQLLRFKMRGQAPANMKAADMSEVKQSEAVQAVLEQSKHSSLQRVGTNYWAAMTQLGTSVASGSSESSQKLIDKAVKDITKDIVQ